MIHKQSQREDDLARWQSCSSALCRTAASRESSSAVMKGHSVMCATHTHGL